MLDQAGSSGWQAGAQNRTPYPCDGCKADRKKCNQEGGIPCVACKLRSKPCTYAGKTQQDNYNQLRNELRCDFDLTMNDSGPAAIYSPGDGFVYHLQLSPYLQRVGSPQVIGTQEALREINSRRGQDNTLAHMFE